MSMSKVKHLFIYSIFIGLLSTSSAKSDLATSYCQAYMPMVDNIIYYRESGYPISIAKDVSDSAFDTNRELWKWLRAITDLTYQDPNLVKNAKNDGRLMADCVRQVRGY